jgi:hypothetical protein
VTAFDPGGVATVWTTAPAGRRAESLVATLTHPSVQALLTALALGPRVAAHTQGEGAAGTPALRLRATVGSLVWTVGHTPRTVRGESRSGADRRV